MKILSLLREKFVILHIYIGYSGILR